MALDSRAKRSIVALLSVGVLVFLSKLWQGDVRSDGLVYAEVAKELLKGGNPLILTFAGKPYFNKPPLLFWLTSLNYKILGINTFSIKLWPALFGVLSGISLYLFSRVFMEEKAAFFAGLSLLLTRDFIKDNVMFHFESSVVFFTLLSMYVLMKDGRSVVKGVVSGLLLGCALLSKGFPGLLGPSVLLVTLIFSKEMRGVVSPNSFVLYLVVGSFIFFLWFFAEAHIFGSKFTEIFLGREVIKRATSLAVFSKGKLYYLREFVTNYWPWLPFFLLGTYVFLKGKAPGWAKVLCTSWFFLSILSILPLRPEYGRYLNYVYPVTAIPVGFFLGRITGNPETVKEWTLRIAVFGFILINVFPIRLHRDYYRSLKEAWPLVENVMGRERLVFLYRPPSRRLGQAILFYFDTPSKKVRACKDIPPGGVVLTRERFKDELSCLSLEGVWKGYAILKKPLLPGTP